MSALYNRALVQINLAVFLWGFTGVLGRAISLGEYPLVVYRILFTIVFVFFILLFRKLLVVPKAKELIRFAAIGTLIAIHWVFFYGAIKLANASIALVCLSTAGVFTVVLDAVFYRARFQMRELLIAAIAILGMLVIYRSELQFKWGIIFGILAALLSSVFTLMNKSIINAYEARLVLLYEMVFGFFALLLLLPLYHYFFPASPMSFALCWRDVALLLLLSYACTVWGQSLALSALKVLSSFTIVLLVNFEPIYGIVLANLFYNENQQMGFGFYAGILLIASSVAIHLLSEKRRLRK